MYGNGFYGLSRENYIKSLISNFKGLGEKNE